MPTGGFIRRALEEKSTHIHIPSYAHTQLRQIKRVRSHSLRTSGCEPNLAELVEATGLDAERIQELQCAANSPISLDDPLYGEAEDQSLGSILPDTSMALEEQVTDKVLGNELDAILEHTLTAREYLVMRLRLGLGGERTCTLEETGRELGVTRERARQIEVSAVDKLRHSALLRHLYESL